MAFIVGLLLPIGIIFLHESMNTRIRSRKDLDALTIPLVGNIPQHGVAKCAPSQGLRTTTATQMAEWL